MVVVVLLSRLCIGRSSVSHTTSAVCCRRCVRDSLLWVTGDVYSRQVSYEVQYRQWWHVILGTR